MAVVQINYTWSDGSVVAVAVSGKARYPQAVADLRAEAIRAMRGAMAELGIVAEVEAELVEPDA